MRKVLIIAVAMCFSTTVYAESIRARVTSVNAENDMVTASPVEREKELPAQINLSVKNDSLRGVGSLDELSVGDEIVVEADRREPSRYDVRSLQRLEDVDFAIDPATGRMYRWHDKLKRGALNIVSSPVEIGRSIYIGTRDENMAYGWTVGLIKGFGNGIVRMGAGFADVVTFPFNFPVDHKAPMLRPEYVWEKPGVDYV